MIEDWFVIVAAIILVLALPVALNVRGAADRLAQANRRNPGPSSLPISMTMGSPHPDWRSPSVRRVRTQATVTSITAIVVIVIGLT